KFNPSGTDAGEFIDTVELTGPTNIMQLDNFNWVVLDWSAGDAELYDPQGLYIDKFTTGLSQPEGITYDPDGNLLIGNGGTSAVKKFDVDGNFIEDVVPSGSGGLVQPNAVIVRENVVAGLEDEQLNKVKVAPTMGNEFVIRTENAPIKKLEIFGMDGKKIADLPISETVTWNASTQSEGIYFLTITMENNKKGTRKIVVKR
ncbi:MAG: T9SS type A sorting domain-containing protein, partial [Flavobacteriaceae bacterium]|nr:T9SS type A sorting domain-containing protein [Flavobacteriaceae bacterium]